MMDRKEYVLLSFCWKGVILKVAGYGWRGKIENHSFFFLCLQHSLFRGFLFLNLSHHTIMLFFSPFFLQFRSIENEMEMRCWESRVALVVTRVCVGWLREWTDT